MYTHRNFEWKFDWRPSKMGSSLIRLCKLEAFALKWHISADNFETILNKKEKKSKTWQFYIKIDESQIFLCLQTSMTFSSKIPMSVEHYE